MNGLWFFIIIILAILYFVVLKPKIDRIKDEKKVLKIFLFLTIFGVLLVFVGGISMVVNIYYENPHFDIGVSILTLVFGIFLMFNSKHKTKTNAGLTEKDNLDEISSLEKLAKLRDKGIITEEEFDAKKKKILGC